MKNFFLSYKNIKCLSLVALALLLIPLLLLSFYSAPAADDFSYGAPAHRAWVESGSVFAALWAALLKVWESFFGWQGTYSAIFLMAIQPAVFSESLYWMTAFIMLASLLAGTFAFCRAFFSRLLGLDKHLADIIAAVLLLLSTQLLPSPVQGFYWFNGSVYYVLFHGLMLLALALGMVLVKGGGGKWALPLLCLLGFVLGGGNYVTALSCCILWFFAEGLLFITKGEWKKLLAPGLVLLAGFALSILAPGNAVRQESQWFASRDPVEAVLLSFKSCIDYSADWLGLPVLGSLCFLALLVLPCVVKTDFKFRFPGLVTAFSYCLVSAMFCPPIYAMGNVGEERILNIIYFAWLLALAVNLVWWLGWLCRRRAARENRLRPAVLALACAALLLGFALPVFSGGSYSSLLALSSLRSGEARAWHDCALRRFEVLNDETVSHARIEPYPSQPYLLFYSDIVDDPQAWENLDMASFYGKDSVSFNTIN